MGRKAKQGRKWTKEDVAFLSEHWGSMDYKRLAARLNRSPRAVYLKGWKEDLGDPFLAADGISVNLLPEIFKVSYYRIFKVWIEKYNMPYKEKCFNSGRPIKIFRIDEFWKWAEKHRDMIDFSCLDKNILGAEPPWVNTKRRLDSEKRKNNKWRIWTKKDDERLRQLLYEFKYTKSELSRILGRTEGAIVCRIKQLGISARPLVKDYERWTREEEESVISMHMNNIKINDISEITGRSVMSVSQKICRYYKKSREDLKNMMGGMMVIATKEEDGKYKISGCFGNTIGNIDMTNPDKIVEYYSRHLIGIPVRDVSGLHTVGEIAEVKRTSEGSQDNIIAIFRVMGGDNNESNGI